MCTCLCRHVPGKIILCFIPVGPFSGILVNRFGTRKIAIIGGLVACGGLIGSSFANGLPMLSVFYGVVTGIAIL